jgi:hypothetical protein
MSLFSSFPKRPRGFSRSWSSLVAVTAVSALGACSATDKGGSSARVGADGNENDDFFEGGSGAGGGGVNTSGQGANSGLVDDSDPGNGQITIDDACVVDTAQAELVEQPVDIILVLDNSGSMKEELRSVEENINVNFASILIESAVDYRVILISRHRDGPRSPLPPPGEEIEETAEDTSICVTQPLSGLAACDTASQPVFSERFFQFNTKVESDDSFDIAIDTYAQPIASDYQEDDEDDMPLAPAGWSAWLRPGAKRVFLEVTDDNEDMSAATFIQQLQAQTPANFGSDPQNPNFIFHSIVGLQEKAVPTDAYRADEPVRSELCTGNDGDVTTAGETYQELSRMTGGLRFPLCQYDAYDVVFRTIAYDVVQTSSIACDFPIPAAPPGLELDLRNVAIQYTPSAGGAPIQFGQAQDFGSCQSNAFYIANDRLNLCSDTCATIRNDPRAAVSVLFTCESTIIIQ